VLFAVGVGLWAASTAYSAYDRYFNQEQSGWQALLGGAADATGISAVYAGITGRDLVTQHHLSLTPAQQRQMLTEGSIQAVGSALVLYGGVRSFLRGRVPVAPKGAKTVEDFLPEAQRRLDATKAKYGNVEAQMMAMSRKDALKRLNGLGPRVEEHLGKIANNPGSRDIPHWTGEIDTWIKQMEDVLPHVGDKTAAEWAAKIAEWKARLGR
jgi:hypothetical protein